MKLNPYVMILIALNFGAFNSVLLRWLELDPGLVTFIRTAVPAIILFLYIKFYKKDKIFRKGYKPMLLASFFNAIRMFLYFVAYSMTTIANGVIMLYTWPIFTSIFGVFYLKEKNKRPEWLLIALAFAGVIVMVANQELSFSNNDILGMSAMLASAAIFAASMVIYKKYSSEYTATESTFYQNVVGMFLFLPFLFIANDGLTFTKVALGIGHYGLLVGILGFVLLFSALKKVKMLHYSLVTYWEVIASVIFGIIFFQEKLNLNIILGGLMIIIAGAGLFIYKQKK